MRQYHSPAAVLLQTSRELVYNLFSRRIGTIFGMLSRRAGLSASAGLSCLPFVFVVHEIRLSAAYNIHHPIL